MQKLFFLALLIIGLSNIPVRSQTISDTTIQTYNTLNCELKGHVLDMATKAPLRYTNIYVLHKHIGTVSNEKGNYSLNISGLKNKDTVRFMYVGYKPVLLTIEQLDTLSAVYMSEEIFNLNEAVIFGHAPDPETIVRNVLKYKDSNYRQNPDTWKIFLRRRNIDDIRKLVLDYKKSTIEELDRQMITKAEKKIPRQSVSYTDFLGNIYFSGKKGDTLKINPIRTIALKEKNRNEMDHLEDILTKLFKNTDKNEYWKLKSGILGGKLELGEKDTLAKNDTINRHKWKLAYFRTALNSDLKYSSLNNKKEWEFLYNTRKYKYAIVGSTQVNGEKVYIIDFVPDKNGAYKGRLYISMDTYALIRTDYSYAPGKTGTGIHLFGIGYTENEFSGSIYFTKKNKHYFLKYFSKKEGTDVSFDRNLTLLKKRKRFLFDKTQKELKIGTKIEIASETSFEILVLNRKEITPKQYNEFKQKKFINVHYIDQFDDNLWKGYSIIEPTAQMKAYKKDNLNNSK